MRPSARFSLVPLHAAVQHECIPHAILGNDVLCQAKSGMGKTAVFVLSILQQLDPKPGECHALILCHTRELAFQVCSGCPACVQPSAFSRLQRAVAVPCGRASVLAPVFFRAGLISC